MAAVYGMYLGALFVYAAYCSRAGVYFLHPTKKAEHGDDLGLFLVGPLAIIGSLALIAICSI